MMKGIHGKGVNGAENACECMLELHKQAGNGSECHGLGLFV